VRGDKRKVFICLQEFLAGTRRRIGMNRRDFVAGAGRKNY
jgi:hypothetical protein